MNLDFINSVLFHPRKSNEAISNKDILIPIEKNIFISARLHMQNKNFPNILFFHGNAELSSEYDDIAHIYNSKKINFIIADYRGYGFSNGTPDIQTIQSDSHIILDYLLDYLTKNNYIHPITLMGRSLGSAAVIELIKHYPKYVNGLIIESGFADESPIFNLIGIKSIGEKNKKKYSFLNTQKIKKYYGPLLIIHAENDHIIPFKHAETLLDSCSATNKTLCKIGLANHNNILLINSKKYFSSIEKFIYSI